MAYILQDIYRQVLSQLQSQLPYDAETNKVIMQKTREKLEKKKGYQRIFRPWKDGEPPSQPKKDPQQPNLKLTKQPSSRVKMQSQDFQFVDPEQQIEKSQAKQENIHKQQSQAGDQLSSMSGDSSDDHLYQLIQNSVTLGIYGLRTNYYRTKTKTINMKLEDVIIKNPRQQFIIQRLNVRLDVVLNLDIKSLL